MNRRTPHHEPGGSVPRSSLCRPLPRHLALIYSSAAAIASAVFAIGSLALPVDAGAQQPSRSAAEPPPSTGTPSVAPDWNDPRVLGLVERARTARGRLAASGDLRTYRAHTQGHVYFFIDPEAGERPLIRIDQVAVDVQWQAPAHFRQRIVGHRSEVRLPVREFAYYLDRMTLVQHGFDDEIRIGSGRDVAGVPHPLRSAPSSNLEAHGYDFRLADSLSLSLSGSPDPLRIYEIEVRPTDPDRPGMVGSIFVDRASASLVRMDFTFTPASYTDPRNDRVSVFLDYGLWEGRYWLPNLQRIEVRREIPEFDLGVGTVIRSVLRVQDYELNVPVADDLSETPGVTRAPLEHRESYGFPEGLYAGMERDGLERVRVDVDPSEIRARAIRGLRASAASGLSPLRLHLPGVSSALRFDRIQGFRVGLGASLRTDTSTRVRAQVGYAAEDERPQGGVTIESILAPEWTATLKLDLRGLTDLGLRTGSAPLVSSVSGITRGEDYRDPYWVSAAGLGLDRTFGQDAAGTAGFGVERHHSGSLAVSTAPLNQSGSFRPVRPVRDGEFFRAELGFRSAMDWPAGGRGWAGFHAGFYHGQPGKGLGVQTDLDARWGPMSGERQLQLEARLWNWVGDPLPQGHRLMGGRGTVPGFAYRAYGGRHASAASLTGSTDLWGALVRARAGLHAGWSDRMDAELASVWGADATDGVVASASVGLGLGWDLVRIDLARGLRRGRWQFLLSIDPRWWDRL